MKRQILAALLALATIAGLTACSGGIFDPNNPAKGGKNTDQCTFMPSTIPVRGNPKLPAGWVHHEFGLRVTAMLIDGETLECDQQWPMPVQLTADGTADGRQGFKLETGEDLPWSGRRETPWVSTMGLDYDPQSHPTVTVRIALTAEALTHDPDYDVEPSDIVSLGCMIYLDGELVMPSIGDGRGMINCVWSGVLQDFPLN